METSRVVFCVLVLLVIYNTVPGLAAYRPRIRTKFGLKDLSGAELRTRESQSQNDDHIQHPNDVLRDAAGV